MEGLTIFNNEQFDSVRTVSIDGEPWFVATDVCAYFGVTNRNRIIQAVDEEDKGGTQMDTLGGVQTVTVVNESGLYSVLFALQPTKARGVFEEYIKERQEKLRAFKRWITHDVLPTIRKTGGYVNDTAQFIDSYFGQLDSAQKHALMMIFNESKRMTAQLKEQAPKVDFYDTFVSSDKCTGLRVTAKELGVPEREFVKFLIDEKYLYRTPSKQLLPYAKKGNDGLFEVKDYYTRSDFVKPQIFFTPQGKQFFYEKLVEAGLIIRSLSA